MLEITFNIDRIEMTVIGCDCVIGIIGISDIIEIGIEIMGGLTIRVLIGGTIAIIQLLAVSMSVFVIDPLGWWMEAFCTVNSRATNIGDSMCSNKGIG